MTPQPPVGPEPLTTPEALVSPEAVVSLLDRLEAQGPVDLADAERLAGRSLAPEIAAGLVLLDDRLGLGPETAEPRPLPLCRLNRHHPQVRQLSPAW